MDQCEIEGCRRPKLGKLDRCKIHDNALSNLLVEERTLMDFLYNA